MAEETAITRSPTVSVENVTASREGNKFTGSWKVPSAATDSNRDDRYESIKVEWVIYHSGYGMDSMDRVYHSGSTSMSSDTFEMNRSKYHPVRMYNYAWSMMLVIRGKNGRGEQGTAGVAGFEFVTPLVPAVEDWTRDGEWFKTKIYSEETKDARERYDTAFSILCSDNIPGSQYYGSYKTASNSSTHTFQWYNEKTRVWEPITGEMSSTQKEIQVRARHGNIRLLETGQSISVQLRARCRGMRGDSGTVSRTYSYGYPVKPVVHSIDVTSLDQYGTVTVRFSSFDNWIDGSKIHLYRYVGTDPDQTPGQISQWTSVTNVDYACKGLTDAVADAYPAESSQTKYVFYKVGFDNGYYVAYSDAFRADSMTRRGVTAEDDHVTIASLTTGDDGVSLELVLAWNNLNEDQTPNDADGSEVTWAETDDMWISTTPPNPYLFPNDRKDPTSQVSGFDNSGKLVIRGVSESTAYYVRARRYKEISGEDTTYGPYAYAPSNAYPIRPVSKAEDVVLIAPEYLQRGKDLPVRWTYSGTAWQTEWVIYKMPDKESVIASGEDANGSYVIPAELLGDDSTIQLAVSVTTGGEWSDSPTTTVIIQDRPEIEFISTSEVKSQPITIIARSATGNVDISLKLMAVGVSSVGPGNKIDQLSGDTVWADKIIPQWVAVDDYYVTSITLPSKLLIHDSASYRMIGKAIDRSSGLQSDEHEMEFTANYDHKAVSPSRYSLCVGENVDRTASIFVKFPDGRPDTDVCDIYRASPDGFDLIASDVVPGSKVLDRFAPFSKNGGLYYRLAMRTEDGDTEFIDIPYNIRCANVRFDWGKDRWLEVPYNLKIDDKFVKDFKKTAYKDGSVSGSWNTAVDRTSSITTEMVRLTTREEIDKVKELAEYPGAVFVRLPNGSAFTGNVMVSTIGESYDSLVLDVKFSADRIDIVDQFKVSNDDIVAPEEPTEDYTVIHSRALWWSDDPPEEDMTFLLIEDFDSVEFIETVSISMSTAVDGYNGWDGFESHSTWTYSDSTHEYTLTDLDNTADAYISDASAITGNHFVITVEYKVRISEETSEETTEETIE